jgi:Domain of unknown function (DUF4783)
MIRYIARIALIALSSVVFAFSTICQEQKGGDKSGEREKIIRDVETGIVKNDVKSFTRYFDKNIYITLREGETGYFSANQAVYVLQNYFESHRFLRFTFSKVNVTDVPLYATGGGTFLSKGSQEQVQIYITVSHVKSGYVITQFCVY